MAFKIKNTSNRRIGVSTPDGLVTLAPGASGEYPDVTNIEAIKLVASVKGSKDEPEANPPAAATPPAAPQPPAGGPQEPGKGK